ncbi:MAG: DNA polymerase IV [Spirochaetaceae bacterium]|nr:DNA polymerase IV [Spirochaetaceae bacterium]
MSRRIVHADMDAFYASVEELDHPEWSTAPLVVGADPRKGNGRGVVSTCNYHARKYGIRSAMSVSKAYSLCPHAIFVPPRMERYLEFSRTIMDVFGRFSPLVEALSLDEAFIDCSGTERLFGDERSLGKQIKQAVKQATGLNVSIGISAVKFVAKIASDLEKPDGLVVVRAGEEREFLAPLSIHRLWGAGPKTCAKLQSLGINTIGDLANSDPSRLPGAGQGKQWRHLINLSKAIDSRDVVPQRERKSIGEERTFSRDLADSADLRRALLRLCSELSYRIRSTGFQGRTVTIKFRYTGFETHTRSQTLDFPVLTESMLRQAALEIWNRVDSELREGRSIRLLGVQVSHAESNEQPELFSLSTFASAFAPGASGSGLSSDSSMRQSEAAGSSSERWPRPADATVDPQSTKNPLLNLERDQKLESAFDKINERFNGKLKRGF